MTTSGAYAFVNSLWNSDQHSWNASCRINEPSSVHSGSLRCIYERNPRDRAEMQHYGCEPPLNSKEEEEPTGREQEAAEFSTKTTANHINLLQHSFLLPETARRPLNAE